MKTTTFRLPTPFIFLFIWLMFSSVAEPLLAQAPSAFKYQAAIRNALGESIKDSAIVVRVGIVKNNPDNSPLYSELHEVTTSSQGLITLEVGRGQVEYGNFEAINWGIGDFFLKIDVNINGVNFIPMGISQLLAVPYALYARSAGPLVYSWEDILEMFGNKAQPTPGMMVFNTTENIMIYYNGTQWVDFTGLCFPQPTQANAGPDQINTPGTSTFLQGNKPKYGTGWWTIIQGEGGTIVNPADSASLFQTVDGGIFTLRWTITNECGVSEDDVVISFCPNLTVPDAGPDQLNIIGNTALLAANTPETGNTGTWSVVNGPDTWQFSDIHNPNAVFTGLRGSEYTLRWTIHTACETGYDDVVISFCPALTMANAGPDQINVPGNQTTLQGNMPGNQNIGSWSIVSGVGGSFDNPLFPNAQFTGLPGVIYVLRWTITTVCETSWDEVSIGFCHTLGIANAGPDQLSLPGNSTTLAGNEPPLANTGVWRILSGAGGTFSDSLQYNTLFTGQPGVIYTIQWNLYTVCEISRDTVLIGFCPDLPQAYAGDDQEHICGPYQLMANAPGPGNNGTWTIVEGQGGSLSNGNDPNAIFAGQKGNNYLLRWHLFNPCYESADTVMLHFEPEVTQANAGPDQLNLPGNVAILEGNAPAQGETGQWQTVEGEGGTFSNTAQYNAQFWGNPGETYLLRWNLNNACQTSIDVVLIGFCPELPQANAGLNQYHLCGAVQLSGNTPGPGNSGLWYKISGEGGTFSDSLAPNALFTGMAGMTYHLVWKLFNACYESYDTVVLIFEPSVSVAHAGADQLNLPQPFTQITGSAPMPYETGFWTVINGEGGVINNPFEPVTSFTGIPGVTYWLTWSVSTECETASDTVTISFCPILPQANAGPDVFNVCSPYTLQGNHPGSGNQGSWNIISGQNGSIINSGLPNATFIGMPGYTYLLTWTLTNPCFTSSDTVLIKIEPPACPANAGPDKLNQPGTSIQLAANTPVVGIGSWRILEGTGGTITDTLNPNSMFYGNVGVLYRLQWKIQSNCNFTTDEVLISFLIPFICGQDNIIDSRDGKVYQTVQIGNQCWMKENLNVGTMIFIGFPQNDPQVIQKYCYGNDPANCQTYGGLYQWNQAMNYSSDLVVQGICPDGWRLPSSADITQFINFLPDSSSCKLRTVGTEFWTNNDCASDMFGFSARGAGTINTVNQSTGLKSNTVYWTSALSASNAIGIRISNTNVNVTTPGYGKTSGMSIRCIKQ